MTIEWQCKEFDTLTGRELFEILKLRQQVFVIEQQCIYPDIDDLDKAALHLYCHLPVNNAGSETPDAYLRILPPGVFYPEVGVGRVLVSPGSRGAGLGAAIMRRAIEVAEQSFAGVPVRISAQQYLERFYTGLGFATQSAPYDEDGIAHIDMVREA